jgi:hypothetical protein
MGGGRAAPSTQQPTAQFTICCILLDLVGHIASTVPPRQQRAAQTIARRLVACPQGGRVPTIAALAAEAGTGAGTVQAALRLLTEAGAVALSSHGHQGTVLEHRDVAQLWAVAAGGPMVGLLPLPTSLEFTGLATALASAAEDAALPLSLTFRHGAGPRLELLRSGRADFMVASAAFADSLAEPGLAVTVLPPYTYFAADSVVVVTRAGEDPADARRVAVDRASFDHSRLTEAEFPAHELVAASAPQIPELVANRDVDAAVWHDSNSSALSVATGLAVHPLSRPSPSAEARASCAAVITTASSDGLSTVSAILEELVDPDALERIQRDVVERKRMPSF